MVKLELDNGKTVLLELVQDIEGYVSVIAVNKKGKRKRAGYLCTFYTDGTFLKMIQVNDSLGFKLNKNNQIKKNNNDGVVG